MATSSLPKFEFLASVKLVHALLFVEFGSNFSISMMNLSKFIKFSLFEWQVSFIKFSLFEHVF